MISERHIFLAEDDEYIRLSLSVTLSKRGYKVTLAENGQEALEKIIALKAAGTPPDLLLTDIRMPGMSGIELIDRLKKLDVSLPVFVITGYGDKDMVVELMRRGCSDFIDKPFSPPDLLGRLLPIFEKKKRNAQKSKSNRFSRLMKKPNSPGKSNHISITLKHYGNRLIQRWKPAMTCLISGKTVITYLSRVTISRFRNSGVIFSIYETLPQDVTYWWLMSRGMTWVRLIILS